MARLFIIFGVLFLVISAVIANPFFEPLNGMGYAFTPVNKSQKWLAFYQFENKAGIECCLFSPNVESSKLWPAGFYRYRGPFDMELVMSFVGDSRGGRVRSTLLFSLSVPFWVFWLTALGLGTMGAVVLARSRDSTELVEVKRLPGCCKRCGYDLRVTPGRCPECGEVYSRARA